MSSTSLSTEPNYVDLFLQNRIARGISPHTLDIYQRQLNKFSAIVDPLAATPADLSRFLASIPPNKYGLAYRHMHFRTLRTFYRWLDWEFELPNPMKRISAPIMSKPILPCFNQDEVLYLIEKAHYPVNRNRAIIALFTESGLRVTELTNIHLPDIDWDRRLVRIWGKGRKEALAPFGALTKKYLKMWLAEYEPGDGNIWGLRVIGTREMLRKLKDDTGMPCNPHTFRRTFASLLRKAGIDTMMIKDLGRWENMEMVLRYTRSVSFEDALKFYQPPLSLKIEEKENEPASSG